MHINNKTSYVFIIIYLVILAGGSLTPVLFKSEIISGWDKLIHFIMYMPLGFLLSIPKIPPNFFFNFLISLGFGSWYGGMMELLQNFVPGRTASFYDAIANGLGVGVGLSLGLSRGWISTKIKIFKKGKSYFNNA